MPNILILEELSPAGVDILSAETDFTVQELYDDDPEKIRIAL